MDEKDEKQTDSTRMEFGEEVEKKEARKLKARMEKARQVWFGLGMFGLIGWSVTIPALIFTGIGLWMDSKSSGTVSWTLTLMVFGITLGCLNAWYWIKRETKDEG